jgi:predicted dehydrogenase
MSTADYSGHSLAFKLRKVARYIRIYGPGRTWVKVVGQKHLAATKDFEGPTWTNLQCARPFAQRRCVAIVGCGSFAFTTIASYLAAWSKDFLVAALDVNKARARSLVERYRGAYATNDFQMILGDPRVRLIYIASNHASHADYAVRALDAGKDVHIEKPHVVNHEQLEQLAAAQERNPGCKIYLGFNRPRSEHFRFLMGHLAAEPGPYMINWFVAGHEIPEDNWYFSPAEGGRILGNLCHWTDLTLEMVGLEKALPCTVVPTSQPGAKSDFVTSFHFADGSVATISFSAKGHTFEGVREVLHVHRGNVLAELRDFQSSAVQIVEKKISLSSFFRDHGHGANIMNSLRCTLGDGGEASSLDYIRATAELFLAAREAHEQRREIVVETVSGNNSMIAGRTTDR